MKWLREYWLIATLMIAFVAAILFAIAAMAVTGDLSG